MKPPRTAPGSDRTLIEHLAHVRWIAGGTGAGKSTVTMALARRHDARLYNGDRAEHDWVARSTQQHHPHLHALLGAAPGQVWAGRSAQEVFRSMASLHGEVIGFLIEDLLALPNDRIVLVDYFGVLPRDVALLLAGFHQAVFLLPSPEFRRRVLAMRYADPLRARTTWGSHCREEMLAKRLARDALWDEEVRQQATAYGLRTVSVDGTRPVEDLVTEVATHLRLPQAPACS
ncbi:hypothetical protein [Microtetraspora niveoalba]|uniref:hypothetical protein n=1 Tax=Microtetraspora niveoalba TaxID=46175 RepID=UPI0012FA39D4|nr:hypothetical protein [Microtetraspora niveoalba]